MNILDIAIAKKLAGGGGGSGTDNYNDLSNLPKINDTTLSGNKSSSALGLQSEINSDSKLASDLVDDTNQDNKFVTSTEKNTWNAKQNAIDSDHKLSSDLVDDANKTNKFVTSTEKQTWNAKQNAIDADHKLSSSLVSFTEAEDAALASGINSSKVGQISTNQTNILYSTRTGAQNLVVCNDLEKIKRINRYPSWTWEGNVYKFGSASFTVNGDGSITVNGTFNSQAFFYVENDYQYDENESRFKGLAESKLWGCPAGGTDSTYFLSLRRIINGESYYYSDYGSGINVGTIASTAKIELFIGIRANTTVSNKTFYPSFTLKSIYDQDSSYCLGALPNYDLTRLESEDRASLAEEIDSGAKNKCNWTAATVHMSQACSYTKTDSGLTIASTTSDGWGHVAYSIGTLPAGNYILSVKISSYSATSATCKVGVGTTADALASISGNGTVTLNFTKSSASDTKIYFYANYSTTAIVNSYVASEIMICTKAAFGVSSAFVPFTLKPPRMIYKSANPDVSTTEAIVSDLTYSIPSNYMARISIVETNDGAPPSKLRLAQDNGMTSTENYKEVANAGDGISMVAVYRAGYAKTIYVSTAAARSGKNKINMLIELFEV